MGIAVDPGMLLLLLFNSLLASASSSSCNQGDLSGDPSDCSVFYQCSQGEKVSQTCPEGLFFNKEKKYCDWPENVSCELGTSSTPTLPPTTSSTKLPSTSSIPVMSSTTTKPSTAKTTTTSSTTEGTETEEVCGAESSEPLSPEVRLLRKSTCLLSNDEVENVAPGRDLNPPNVKIVESLLSGDNFTQLFPKADKAYTYTNLLKSFAKFPSVCTTEEVCRRILATIFAHFQQETAGLIYLREINKSNYCATWSNWVRLAYPCSPGKQYYGRGSKQLTWNYNYGAFSVAMYGRSSVLLENPELVSDTWLNFASALWFFVTPQPPKPSMLSLVDGSWQPNAEDQARGLKPGLGATTMAINGAIECGQSPGNSRASLNRQKAYKRFAKELGVSIAGEKLDCRDMQSFSAQGSANPAIYWAPEQGCRLVRWQTAFSALVEGDHHLCVSSITRAADFTPASPFLVALLPYTSWI